MCNYFSCIVTRDLKVYWSKSGPNHETVIAEAKLDDSKLQDRDFVRIEITPNDAAKVTRNEKDWTFKVDEPNTIPDWFEKKQKQAEKKCWIAWKESVQINLLLGEEEKEFTDTFVLLWGSSHAVLWGSSHAELRDSSHAELRGSSHAVLWGSSHAVLWDSSHAELRDSSHAVLRSETSTVLDAASGKIVVHVDAHVEHRLEVGENH